MRASSYIPLPKEIEKKRACLNIQNNDQKCFLWCVLAKLHPVEHGKHPYRVSKYRPYENELNMSGIEYPVKISSINKFERQNNDISINVHGLEGNILPLRVTKKYNAAHHVDLLYIADEETESGHYVLIKDFARLVGSQISKHQQRKHMCRYYFHACTTEEILNKHLERCQQHGAQRVNLPKPGENKLYFKRKECQLRLPFIFYADFESIFIKHQYAEKNAQQPWTEKYQTHEACSFGMYTVSTDKRFYSEPKTYFGKDSAEKFLDTVTKEALKIRQYLYNKIPMERLSSQQYRQYQTATRCHICKKEIKENQRKVRDHDHLTGKYRGPAHSNCNLQYRINPEKIKIPCVIHNLKNYDAHLI